MIYGISQEGVLGAFEELWERLQIKFTPYLGEAVKVERGVKAVKITDKEADRYAQEQAGSDYEPKVEIKSKDKKVKSGDAGNESSAQSSDDVKVMRITRKKTRAKKKFGKLMAIEHSSDDSESDRAGVVHTIRLMGSSEIVRHHIRLLTAHIRHYIRYLDTTKVPSSQQHSAPAYHLAKVLDDESSRKQTCTFFSACLLTTLLRLS